jgi:hypothetical protein
MSRLPERFVEDRALRDAARAVLVEDIERLRESLSQQGIASRLSTDVSATMSNHIRSGARDIFAQVKAQAGDRKGVIAVLIGALILWLARAPIMEWIEELLADSLSELDPEPTEIATPPEPSA